jgi:hypothetical protein
MVMESVTRLTSNLYSSLCCLLFGLLSADVKRDAKNVVNKLTCVDIDSTPEDGDAMDGVDNAMDQGPIL